MGCCENVIALLRPFFVEAISKHPSDPMQSPHVDAYLAVIERCSVSDFQSKVDESDFADVDRDSTEPVHHVPLSHRTTLVLLGEPRKAFISPNKADISSKRTPRQSAWLQSASPRPTVH